MLARSEELWRTRDRQGAWGGRGYHFQDAALGWLLAAGVTGSLPIGLVVPEGFDDASAQLAKAVVEVQAKSRQVHLGSVPATQLSSWVGALSRRHAQRLAEDPARRVILIVERGVTETGLDRVAADMPELRGQLDESLGNELGDDARELILRRLHILILESPLARAAQELAEARELSPAVAALAAQRLVGAVISAHDANAVPNVRASGITVTDATALVDQTVELVDLRQLEAALAAGHCEAVDFSAADDDPRYLSGVATTPAHVTAGIVVDRPDEVAEVAAVLREGRRCLIAGPSGQGKSALAWLTVHASRHAIRWYRVRELPPGAAPAIDRLTRSLAASAASPVGFVVDDIGRLGPPAWDGLVEEFRHRPGVLMLGTCREEDVHDLTTLPDVTVMRPRLGPALAEEIWQRLRAAGETSWPAWAEPLEQSRELLLEYTHLLTRGERLETVVGSQVQRLFQDGRDATVAVLRAVAVADILGTALPIAALARAASLSELEVREAARRLADELLVRVDGDVVGGLHELRSRAASWAAHELGFADLRQTVASLLGEVSADGLANAVRRASALVSNNELLVRALARRVERSCDARDLAEALRGLRLVEEDAEAAKVVAELVRQSAPGQLAETVWTRLGGRHLHDSVVLTLSPSSPMNPPDATLRSALADSLRIVLTDLAALDGPGILAVLLVELAGTDSDLTAPDGIATAAARVTVGGADAAAVLDAARMHGEAVHRAAVKALGGSTAALATIALDGGAFRLSAVQEVDGVVTVFSRAPADSAWWEAHAARSPSDVLAALGEADDVAVVRVDSVDQVIPPLAWGPEVPRIVSRSAAEPNAQQRRTTGWRAAVLAAVGAPRWSERLEREVPLMTACAEAIEDLVHTIAANRAVSKPVVQTLETLGKRAMALPPEPAERIPPEAASRFGAAAEPDPVVALLADPGRLILPALRRDLMLVSVIAHRLWRIARDLAAGPRWALVPDGSDARAACARLADAIYALRAVAGERVRGTTRSRAAIRSAAVHAVDGVRVASAAGAARRYGDARLVRIAGRLERTLAAAGVPAEVTVVDADEDHPAIVWPPGVLLVTVDLASATEWPDTVAAIVAARATVVDEQRSVSVLARVAGKASEHLSGEVARAWWPRRGVPESVGVAADTEPRGDAWAEGVSAAGDVRWGREHLGVLESGSTAGEQVAAVVAVAEGRLEAASGALADLSCDEACFVLARLAEGSPVDDVLAAEADRMALELADLDLQGS